MGQCSTLPAETRNSPTNGSQHPQFSPTGKTTNEDKKKRLSEGGRRESLDFNAITPDPPQKRPDPEASEAFRAQARDPDGQPEAEPSVEPMEVDAREQAPIAIPPPPEGAVRTRCYKLNLNSELVGITATQKSGVFLGPYSEPPPFLTYSSSEDSQDISATKVAIKTAQIFRGITVGRDGTILSQNARATRSSRNSKTKRGEKSRQAAKIDKAKDLVEEAVTSAQESDEPTNMVSLVIMGEYDDMKQLVRDGSKKLREAEGLPDETLLSTNRPRNVPTSPIKAKTKNTPTSATVLASSSRKRNSVSPNFVNGQRSAAMQSPEQVTATAQVVSPPKLKSHPRDNRPTRREDRASMRMRLESCSDFMDPRQPGASGNNDWSHAWNIWNCGMGAMSPHQPSSPNDGGMVFEGRDAAFGAVREGGITGRAN